MPNVSFAIPMSLAVWAIPAEPEFSFYSEQIAHFVRTLGGSAYRPHVTAYFGQYPLGVLPPAEIESISAVLSERQQITVDVLDARMGTTYTKQLYLSLRDSSGTLSKLSEDLLRYELDPHLSLWYGRLDESKRETILSQVKKTEFITLNSLSLVLTPAGIERYEDLVAAWEPLAEFPLRQKKGRAG